MPASSMPPARFARHVGDVGQRRVETLAQFLRERHRPAALADLAGQFGDPVADRSVPITPMVLVPSATTCAPVRVEVSNR